ncbi:MAG: carboxypeptidase regulatory-like domain-containing protein, partial [Planctomycetia bacterium]|nr:carboxypeptidase regulatory-like domain-containing protein [Planctomycetia bacterium]
RPAAGAKVEVSITTDGRGPRPVFRMNGVDMGQRTVTTDKDGRFEVPACEVGTATLTVSAAGAAPSRRTLKLESEGASPSVTVDLRPGVRLEGVVLDDTGKPVKGVRVTIEGGLVGLDGDDGYVPEESATTKEDGRFALDGLPSGTVTVAVYGPLHRPLKTTAATGAPVELRVSARSAADARRLEEIQKELGEVGQRFMNAKDDKEREAIQKRLMELSAEQQRLQGDGPVAVPLDDEDEAPSGPR